MRLLLTTDTVGGVWTFTQELATGLLERGCTVRLVSFGRAPSAAQQAQCDSLTHRFPRRFSYVPSEIPLEWMDENDRAFEQGSQLLLREAALFAPDLIHCNQFCFGSLQASAPRVLTAHSDVLTWASACRNAPLDPSPWLQRYIAMVQAGLLAANAVVAPTRWMLDALAENFAIPRIAHVIPNGRSIASQPDSTRALQAVTAGRLWDQAKGIELLADVESPIPIAIAGDTRDGREAQWTGFRWMGELGEQEIIALLRSSAVYLCLSKYEPFGLAPLEAALCGCAVLARDIPSLREVWAGNALYFRDAAELSSILRMLYENPEMLRRAQNSSQQRAQIFSRDRMVDAYLGLFGQILQGALRAEHVA